MARLPPSRHKTEPLTMFPQFHGQKACQPQVAKLFCHLLHHGRLAAAGETGQEQVLEPGE
jgi:hypothetical protein